MKRKRAGLSEAVRHSGGLRREREKRKRREEREGRKEERRKERENRERGTYALWVQNTPLELSKNYKRHGKGGRKSRGKDGRRDRKGEIK